MTRILFVSGTVPPSPCGVGDYTFKLAQSLATIKNIDAAILTGVTSDAQVMPPQVSVFPVLNSWKLSQIIRVVCFLKSWKPDIVHVQYPTQGYGRGRLPDVIPLIARLMGSRTAQTWHEGFTRKQVGGLILRLAAGSRKIVVRADFLDRVHPWLRRALRRCKLSFIPNASAIPRTNCPGEVIMEERRKLLQGQARLIMFFGFLYPFKGVELLFDIADPSIDHIIIAGAAEADSPYLRQLYTLASRAEWEGKVSFTGFVTPERAAMLLAASDAVILPFRQGGGHWNTSIHSATLNGCFVITTSNSQAGYDDTSKVYYARPDDVDGMRSALGKYCGPSHVFEPSTKQAHNEWDSISRTHQLIYQDLLAEHLT